MKLGIRGGKDDKNDKDNIQIKKVDHQQMKILHIVKPALKNKVELDKLQLTEKSKPVLIPAQTNTKPIQTKNSCRKQTNQLQIPQLKQRTTRIEQSKLIDEKVGDNNISITSHRFSDIYQPSKFIQDANIMKNILNGDTSSKNHARHKSLMGSNNFNNVIPSNIHTRGDIQICMTEAYDDTKDNCDIWGKSPSSQEFEQINLDKRKLHDADQLWGFQAQYKNERAIIQCKEGDDPDVDLISPYKRKRTPSQYEAQSIHNSLEKNRYFDSATTNRERASSYADLGDLEYRSSTLSSLCKKLEQYTFPNTQQLSIEKSIPTLNMGSNNLEIQKNDLFCDVGKGTLRLLNSKSGKAIFDPKSDSHEIFGSDSTRLECEDTLNQQHSIFGPHSNNHQNTSNTTILINPFNINCEESIDISGFDKKDSEREKYKVPGFWKTESEFKQLNPEEEIQMWIKNIDISSEVEVYYENLVLGDAEYAPDTNYFATKQNNISIMMRAILLDWMMEVCSEFFLKRDTLYQAINFVDRYLSIVPEVPKWELQLIGVASMFLACKMEEICPPKVNYFAKSTDDGYTPIQIIEMEIKISKALKWKLAPVTLYNWANWYMKQWDEFAETSKELIQAKLIHGQDLDSTCFKQANEQSYTKYRELMQILDLCVLNYEIFQFQSRDIISAIMYLVLGKAFKEFTEEEIFNEFKNDVSFIIQDLTGFNSIFAEYLKIRCKIEMDELVPVIQYISPYFAVQICCELPYAAKKNPDVVLSGHYEEFVSYQTHSTANLQLFKQSFRKR